MDFALLCYWIIKTPDYNYVTFYFLLKHVAPCMLQ